MSETKQKIINFLIANGWELSCEDDYQYYDKSDSVSVGIGEDEVVFIDDTGDFAHIALDYYTVIGFVFVHRLLMPIIPEQRED